MSSHNWRELRRSAKIKRDGWLIFDALVQIRKVDSSSDESTGLSRLGAGSEDVRERTGERKKEKLVSIQASLA